MAIYDVSILGADKIIRRRAELFAIDAASKFFGLPPHTELNPRYIQFENDEANTNVFYRVGLDGKLTETTDTPNEFFISSYEEIVEEDTVMYASQTLSNSVPIFLDKEIDLMISPIYQRYEASISLQFHSKSSRSKIVSIIEKCRHNASRDLRPIFDLPYLYPVGEHVMGLLEEVYNKKIFRYKQGYLDDPKLLEMSFKDYIKLGSCNQIVFPKQGLEHKYKTPMVRHTQTKILLILNDEPFSVKIEKDDTKSTYFFNLSFKFYYAKPTVFQIQRPPLIYNFNFDNEEEELEYTDPFERNNIMNLASKDGMAFFKLNRLQTPVLQILSGIGLLTEPYVDKPRLFNLPDIPKLISTTLIKVDEENLNELIHLDDLYSNIRLSKECKEFMILERDYIKESKRSVFFLGLLKNGRLDYKNPILLQEDGMMMVEHPLDLRYLYRIGLFINPRMLYIDQYDKLRIQEHVNRIGSKEELEYITCLSKLNIYNIFKVFDKSRYRESEYLKLQFDSQGSMPFKTALVQIVVNMTRPIVPEIQE